MAGRGINQIKKEMTQGNQVGFLQLVIYFFFENAILIMRFYWGHGRNHMTMNKHLSPPPLAPQLEFFSPSYFLIYSPVGLLPTLLSGRLCRAPHQSFLSLYVHHQFFQLHFCHTFNTTKFMLNILGCKNLAVKFLLLDFNHLATSLDQTTDI